MKILDWIDKLFLKEKRYVSNSGLSASATPVRRLSKLPEVGRHLPDDNVRSTIPAKARVLPVCAQGEERQDPGEETRKSGPTKGEEEVG